MALYNISGNTSITRTMPRVPRIPRIQLVTNCYIPCHVLQQRVMLAMMHGVDCLQYRAGPDEVNCYETARFFAELCHQTRSQYIVNDHVDIAVRLRAEGFDAGVWLGQNDMSAAAAREALGDDAFIGLSVNTEIEAETANRLQYLQMVSSPAPLTHTHSKWAWRAYEHYVKYQKHPMVAIGGITHDNIQHILATGIEGIALSGAILRADDIENATKCLVDLCNYPTHEA